MDMFALGSDTYPSYLPGRLSPITRFCSELVQQVPALYSILTCSELCPFHEVCVCLHFEVP